MNSFFDAASFIFIASIKGSALIILVLAAQKLCSRLLPAHWRYLLWFTVVVALVTPVGFEAALLPQTRAIELTVAPPAYDTTYVTELRDTAGLPESATISPPATAARNEPPAMTETLPRDWISLLPYLWLAGVLLVAATIALSTLRFAGLLRRARPVSGAMETLLRRCTKMTGCKRAVSVLQSADVDVPMIAGQLRPVLLLPPNLEQQLSESQLRHVFIHELMHLQRGDIVSNWIVALVQALHWFNPLVWFAFFRMRQDRELACDAATLRHLEPAERAAYGHTLLQLNETHPGLRVPAIALGMLHDGSPLRMRILMLAEPSSHSLLRGVAAALMVLPLAALAFSQPVPAVRKDDAVTRMENVQANAVVAATVPPQAAVGRSAAPAAESAVKTQAAVPASAAPDPVDDAPAGVVSSVPAVSEAVTPVDEYPASFEIAPAVEALTNRDIPPPVTTLLAAVTAAAPIPAATENYAGLDEIERLTATIAETKDDKLSFIDKWNAMGMACDARKDKMFGALSASCQRIRTAQRRGEIFRFGYECYQLNALQLQQVEAYRTAGVQLATVETALRANERDLAAMCGKDTHESTYPAFAAMMADAEALKYFPPRGAVSDSVMVTRMNAEVWRNGIMNTASSMFVTGASTVTPGPVEPAYNPMPTGSADFGGFTGGAAAAPAAPAAPQ